MKKILIAENKKKVRDLLKLVFRLSGYKKLYFAKNSDSCVRKAKKVNPDLILLNENIHGHIDITDVLALITTNRSTSSGKVIMLSERSGTKKVAKPVREGVSDLIELNFKPLELIEKVENCIGSNKKKIVTKSENLISFAPRTFSPVLYSVRV